MQEIVRNPYNVADPLRVPMHLRPASNGDLFNHQSMLNSESDECHSESDDYNIHFNQKPNQDFGLGYWMKHTNNHPHESQLPRSKSPNHSAFISKPNPPNNISNKRTNPSENNEKSKKSKNNSKVKKAKEKKSATKFNSSKSDYNIPRLKIPKDIVKKYLKTLSPLSSSSSSSSSSESSPNQKVKCHKIEKSKRKSKRASQSKLNNNLSDSPLSDHNDSSCLQKSFLSSKYSKPQPVYLLSVASHDIMHLSMTIDHKSICNISSLPVITATRPDLLGITDSVQSELVENNSSNISDKCEEHIDNNDIIITGNNDKIDNIDHSSEFLLDRDKISLLAHCDKQELENNSTNDHTDQNYNDFESFSHLSSSPINNRKRLLDHGSESDLESGVVAKKKTLDATNCNQDREDQKLLCGTSVAKYVRLLMIKMKYFEEMMHEKYCLSQPNAMKFLAQNHAFNWESYKSDLSQLHLVPCEFIAEIFHRALHCFGLEKRILKETLSIDSSPNNRLGATYFTDYKKVRDEYSFSLKRVRYGIGVIDDLFKRKINFQSTQPNKDVMVVRKWKHLIYYLCLQAKAVFMTKEMQYYNYTNYATQSGAFDGDCNILFNTTPIARNSSSLLVDTHSKLQFSKDGSRVPESKFIKTTPEHLSQFDMDVSPHSYDSGKGSSIRLSSNGNSQVSGWQTTSSLNSTPHSFNEAQLNLPGFHMYRIDEYLKAANEFVQFLPETLQLHNRIISKIGLEPNANCSDNMMRFINYTEVCQQICKQDAMSECLQRLLSRAVRL